MELVIEKYAKFIIKSGKRDSGEGIEPPSQERISTLKQKEKYKLFGILPNTPREKKKFRKKKFRWTNKHLATKLCSWNLIKWINTMPVFLEKHQVHS